MIKKIIENNLNSNIPIPVFLLLLTEVDNDFIGKMQVTINIENNKIQKTLLNFYYKPIC